MELLLLAALGVVGYLTLRPQTPQPLPGPVVTPPNQQMPQQTPAQPVVYQPGTMTPVIPNPPGGIFGPSGFPAINLPPGFPLPTGFVLTDLNTNTFAGKAGDTLAVFFQDAALGQLPTTDPASYAANNISTALSQYGFGFQLMNLARQLEDAPGTDDLGRPVTSAIPIPLVPNAYVVAGTLTGGAPRTLPRDLTMNPRITVLAVRPA